MIINCAWHPVYFGHSYVLGEKEPYDDDSQTDGMCPKCEIKFLEELE